MTTAAWPPPGPARRPGALVSGWAAFALDTILARYGEVYARAMTNPVQRAEFESAARAIHRAALDWQQETTTDIGSGEVVVSEIPAGLSCEVTTDAAAGILDVSSRRICQMAPEWEAEGLARKVGRSWLFDGDALRIEAQRRRAA